MSAPPPLDGLATHYDETYREAISAAADTNVNKRWREHRELIQRYKQSGAILDIGCGSGGFLRSIANTYWKLHGIELQPSMAAKAQLSSGADVFVGPIEDASFPPESFDVITCFDVLEHVYQPQKVLIKVREWLKPDGVLFVVVPNVDSWEANLFGGHWYGLELPRHVFHFSPRSLRYLASTLGLEALYLGTRRTTYVAESLHYLCSTLLRKMRIHRSSVPTKQRNSLMARGVRKSMQMAVTSPFGRIAAFAERGASIAGVFRKNSSIGPRF